MVALLIRKAIKIRAMIGGARGAKEMRCQRERYGLRVDRGADVVVDITGCRLGR